LIASISTLQVPFLFAGGLMGVALAIIIASVPQTEKTTTWQKTAFKVYLQELRETAGRHYRVLGTVGVGQLFAQMVRSGRDVLIPLYGSDILGLEVAAIGWISSLASAVDMLLFYPVGIVMDRYGRKYVIVPSFLVQGVGLGLIPLTGGFSSLAVVGGLIGFGNGLGSGTMMTLGADLSPEKGRGEFLGIWRLIGDVGFTVGPLVAGMVAGALALPTACLVVGGSGVLASSVFAFLVPETRKGRE
jgi:MFS family permease